MTADAASDEACGWIVTVSTPAVGGGEPAVEVYFVAIADQVDAIEAVRAAYGATQGALVTAHQEISKSLMAALSLKGGDVVVW
jgi:hypothetical protein